MPNNLVDEVLFTKHFIHHNLDVMQLPIVKMHDNVSIFGQQVFDQYETFTQEFNEFGTRDSVLIGFLILATLEFPSCGKWRVDIHQPDPVRTVSVTEFARLLHLQQRLHRLKIVAENQHVMPIQAIPTEGADRLKRHGQRVRDDIFLAVLAVVNQFVFPFFWREQNARPFGRDVFVLFEQSYQFLSLFWRHNTPPSSG